MSAPERGALTMRRPPGGRGTSVLNHLQASLRGARLGAQQPVEGDLGDLLRHTLLGEGAVLPEPARQPVDHSEEAEGRRRRVHVLQPPFRLEFVQEAAQAFKVFELAARYSGPLFFAPSSPPLTVFKPARGRLVHESPGCYFTDRPVGCYTS